MSRVRVKYYIMQAYQRSLLPKHEARRNAELNAGIHLSQRNKICLTMTLRYVKKWELPQKLVQYYRNLFSF